MIFEECIRTEPGDLRAHYLAATSCLHMRRWEKGAAYSRVAAAGDPRYAAAWCNLALGLRELGKIREAGFAARRAVTIDPQLAGGWVAMGLVEQDAEAWEAAHANILRAIDLDPGLASAYVALANLEQLRGHVDTALEAYGKASALDPAIAEVPYSRGHLYHKVTGDLDAAIANYREAIALRDDFALAHHNLAHALFLTGRFAEAWAEYRWRPPRLEFEARCTAAGQPYAPPAEIPPAGSRLLVVAEQGLGDLIFFLRFAPILRRRGVVLDLAGDARLEGMLTRTGLFDRFGANTEGPGDEVRPMVLAADLPLLLPADERGAFLPPLTLLAEASRITQARARLAALGPPPYIGLAWRAGQPKSGPGDSLHKEVPLERLGAALKEVDATWISIQREPRAGERETLACLLGSPVHDLSACNEDLEELLALLSVIDRYVGVSSTSVHLRAGCGGPADVLVPFPHEWRWMAQGESPWFPGIRVFRQASSGSWDDAFARLAGPS